MSQLSFKFTQLFKNVRGLSRRRLLLLAYPVLLLFSGIWQNPLFACIIAGIYELGLAGLYLVNESRYKVETVYQRAYVVLGGLLVLVCLLWLEMLYIIMPFVSA